MPRRFSEAVHDTDWICAKSICDDGRLVELDHIPKEEVATFTEEDWSILRSIAKRYDLEVRLGPNGFPEVRSPENRETK